jgi:hypothetical protein
MARGSNRPQIPGLSMANPRHPLIAAVSIGEIRPLQFAEVAGDTGLDTDDLSWG